MFEKVNMTVIEKGNTLADVVQNMNTLSNGVLGVGILIVMWIAIAAHTSKHDGFTRAAIASMSTAVTAAFFRALGIISDGALAGAVVIFGISIALLFLNDRR